MASATSETVFQTCVPFCTAVVHSPQGHCNCYVLPTLSLPACLHWSPLNWCNCTCRIVTVLCRWAHLLALLLLLTPTAEMPDDISRSMSEYGCINICLTKHPIQTARQPLLASRNPDHLTMWGILATCCLWRYIVVIVLSFCGRNTQEATV